MSLPSRVIATTSLYTSSSNGEDFCCIVPYYHESLSKGTRGTTAGWTIQTQVPKGDNNYDKEEKVNITKYTNHIYLYPSS